MPTSVTDMVYWVLTGVLAICLAYIGWSLKTGFSMTTAKLSDLSNDVKALTQALQQEREARMIANLELRNEINLIKAGCARHEKTPD